MRHLTLPGTSRPQALEDILDEDELSERHETSLQTTQQYDTFASSAANRARQDMASEAQARPSAIPGLVLEELVTPIPDSAGRARPPG